MLLQRKTSLAQLSLKTKTEAIIADAVRDVGMKGEPF